MSHIKTWSFSRLQDWDRCKLAAYLKHAERVPDPNPSNTASDRGSEIHDMAEAFVRGERKTLPIELAAFEGEFVSLATSYRKTPGLFEMENEWGFDRDWNSVPYATAWGKMKLDLMYVMRPNFSAIVDYKTGKKFGNETKHGSQIQLYSTGAFCRYDWLEYTEGEVWYLDQNEMISIKFERETAFQRYLPYWNKKAVDMTEATDFPPNPNILSCKYCPYGDDSTYDKTARYGPTSGTGHCDKRFVDKTATNNFYQRMRGAKK